ncbi:MAG: sugar ABC transporter permease, partial [Spirochaetota bacterium]
MVKKIVITDRELAKVFLIPSILILLLLDFYPILSVISVSLQNKGLFDQVSTFAAFKNYISISNDKYFLISLKNSLIWTISTTFFEVLFGTSIALLLNRDFKFRNLARSLLLVPYVIPAVVSTLIWKYMFNDLVGLMNYILKVLHISANPITFLSSPILAMIVVISVNVWTYTPFVIISVLAALQGINPDLYSAADVDGANKLQKFTNVIVPSIAPVLVIVTLLRTVWNFQKFDIIYLMTKGGPLMSTTTIPIMIYNEAFGSFNIGRASSMAIVVFIILF